MPIETGPRSHAELLLSPGSFLRVGEQSSVVFDSIDLTNIADRVLKGAAIIEVAEAEKHTPIHVATGNLRMVIVSPGLYRFSGDTAIVMDGKLRTVDPTTIIKKGKQVTAAGDSYIQNRTELAFADDLDGWSAQRTASLARSNVLAYSSYSGSNGYWLGGYSPYFINGSAWLYSPLLNGFTFIPQSAYRSYYGFTFIPQPTFGLSPGGIRLPDLNLAFLHSCWGAEWLFQHRPFRRPHFRSGRRPQIKASNHQSQYALSEGRLCLIDVSQSPA
jgi:hypothetical protein